MPNPEFVTPVHFYVTPTRILEIMCKPELGPGLRVPLVLKEDHRNERAQLYKFAKEMCELWVKATVERYFPHTENAVSSLKEAFGKDALLRNTVSQASLNALGRICDIQGATDDEKLEAVQAYQKLHDYIQALLEEGDIEKELRGLRTEKFFERVLETYEVPTGLVRPLCTTLLAVASNADVEGLGATLKRLQLKAAPSTAPGTVAAKLKMFHDGPSIEAGDELTERFVQGVFCAWKGLRRGTRVILKENHSRKGLARMQPAWASDAKIPSTKRRRVEKRGPKGRSVLPPRVASAARRFGWEEHVRQAVADEELVEGAEVSGGPGSLARARATMEGDIDLSQ